jgi:DNA polymerase
MWGMEQEKSALTAALALQCDWGADEALMESPADRLAVRDASARAPEAARPALAAPVAVDYDTGPSAARRGARALPSTR